MALLSATDLADLRAVQSDAMTAAACTIKTPSSTPDGTGRQTTTWASATVAARKAPTGGQPDERVIADRIEGSVPYTITLPYGTTVTEACLLTIGGIDHEIKGVLDGGTYGAAVRCVCVEVS